MPGGGCGSLRQTHPPPKTILQPPSGWGGGTHPASAVASNRGSRSAAQNAPCPCDGREGRQREDATGGRPGGPRGAPAAGRPEPSPPPPRRPPPPQAGAVTTATRCGPARLTCMAREKKTPASDASFFTLKSMAAPGAGAGASAAPRPPLSPRPPRRPPFIAPIDALLEPRRGLLKGLWLTGGASRSKASRPSGRHGGGRGVSKWRGGERGSGLPGEPLGGPGAWVATAAPLRRAGAVGGAVSRRRMGARTAPPAPSPRRSAALAAASSSQARGCVPIGAPAGSSPLLLAGGGAGGRWFCTAAVGPAPAQGRLRRGGRRSCPSAAMARGGGRGRRAGPRAPPATVSGAARVPSRGPGSAGRTIAGEGGGERRRGLPARTGPGGGWDSPGCRGYGTLSGCMRAGGLGMPGVRVVPRGA